MKLLQRRRRTATRPPRAAQPQAVGAFELAEANRTRVAQALGAPLQARLRLGAVDDSQEQEADCFADAVVQRQCTHCAEQEVDEPLQREARAAVPAGGDTVTAATASAIQSHRGGGMPLPAAERGFFEPRLPISLSRVRLHTDNTSAALASALGARAFTVGTDVFFGADEYRPATAEGRHLLAHELAHVHQQTRGEGSAQRKIDKVDVGKKRIDLYLSIGIYGARASPLLASKWKNAIEKNWSCKLEFANVEIDARVHAKVTSYPKLPDSQLMHIAVDENNAVFVENNSFRSIVNGNCLLLDDYSCGRWAADADDMVVAHEAGHLMGLLDQYVDKMVNGKTQSTDQPGHEKDIMAKFWNDNGQTDFSRAWLGALFHYYVGSRS